MKRIGTLGRIRSKNLDDDNSNPLVLLEEYNSLVFFSKFLHCQIIF